ncbi:MULTISPECIES: exonuclease SbcCD subunit D [Roseovarius]|uniref:Nuclease SbcCD subunit D n=2 Tax=Roseovarius TaxID=74030 RepID=A0A0T5NS54_9RHOB|nr:MULTISPECIES: exonuclease SbcCD subunit D [Roseovarius]KRS11771.1 ATP-dependent dsDNA exonuclease [Roseovarius indicus]QEW30091.1 Nuclease SbcCD subunit D [Roseovarius indicus]SFE73721.1 Exodeoxyribonuclease I subunit D [Roseovarius indicus]SHM52230.1 Exodeoxyribonuclease I subunit D [Roseovarius pacificus]GGO62090.1 nuclease SbcCD subunit D [Roseovarius pacificus]
MRILHTADLHLGRQFNGIPLDSDHAAILDQIVSAITSRDVDVLVIAGDIFDRAAPPTSAVRQFNGFLARVASETDAAVVMIAGNHDSGDRIASMAIMTDTRRALIRGAISADEKPLVLTDAHGPVAFTGLPFAYEYAARECFSDEALHTPEDVLAAQVACGRRNIPDGTRWVVVSHAFVAGASSSESERPLTRVGGIETVSSAVFEGAHYVALGHLHRPQSVGAPHIRYSGSPLAFGFDESDCQKSMSLVEIDAVGQTTIESIPFTPIRHVRVLKGRHAELLLADRSDDFIKAVLTDDAPVIDGMKRIRDVFPNACELIYERDEQAPEVKSLTGRALAVANPVEVIGDFVEHVRDEGFSEKELEVVASALGRLRETEDVK